MISIGAKIVLGYIAAITTLSLIVQAVTVLR